MQKPFRDVTGRAASKIFSLTFLTSPCSMNGPATARLRSFATAAAVPKGLAAAANAFKNSYPTWAQFMTLQAAICGSTLVMTHMSLHPLTTGVAMLKNDMSVIKDDVKMLKDDTRKLGVGMNELHKSTMEPCSSIEQLSQSTMKSQRNRADISDNMAKVQSIAAETDLKVNSD